MKVVAAKGTKCPMEGKPRQYIDDRAGADVPETTYYRRLLADGSLVHKTTGGAKAEDKKGAKS
ncbi:MAG: DUF2635 domain-containing protein [Desulfobacterales bacterium]|nr:DUF2635 domain-containing protein [Desulfobacterales bacterium]